MTWRKCARVKTIDFHNGTNILVGFRSGTNILTGFPFGTNMLNGFRSGTDILMTQCMPVQHLVRGMYAGEVNAWYGFLCCAMYMCAPAQNYTCAPFMTQVDER